MQSQDKCQLKVQAEHLEIDLETLGQSEFDLVSTSGWQSSPATPSLLNVATLGKSEVTMRPGDEEAHCRRIIKDAEQDHRESGGQLLYTISRSLPRHDERCQWW